MPPNIFVQVQKKEKNNNGGLKIIWFNPPYRYNVATVVAKKFLLLDRHFAKTHKFYKIYNWNNIKGSYSSALNSSSMA